jgi:hypothetical protein
MKKTIIKIIKNLIVLVIIIFLVVKFVPGGKNIVNSFSVFLFHNKVTHSFTDEEINYLEKEVFGFNITEYGDITAGKLLIGKDGGLLIEVDNIENAEKFKASINKVGGSTPQSMHGDRKFINGAEGRSEYTTYKINGHRIEVYIYQKDNETNVEIRSGYITNKVYNILGIPVIDN